MFRLDRDESEKKKRKTGSLSVEVFRFYYAKLGSPSVEVFETVNFIAQFLGGNELPGQRPKFKLSCS